MKKLLLKESDLPTNTYFEINEVVASHFMYGIYDFDLEKIFRHLKSSYGLDVIMSEGNNTLLQDKNGKCLVVEMVEEHYSTNG